MDPLQTSIEYLKGIGPNRANLLREELGIRTYQDLLHFFPNRYIDRSAFHTINSLPKTNAELQIKGQILNLKIVQQKRGKRLVATFSDGQTSMEMVWFRGHKWMQEQLKLNTPYVAFGRLSWYGSKASMPHPDLTLETDYEATKIGALHPVYPSTEKLVNKGVSQRIMKQMMTNLFTLVSNQFQENLPDYMLKELQLISRKAAIINAHFPTDLQALNQAQRRLKFEELFYIQLQLIQKNRLQKQKIKGYVFPVVGELFSNYFNNYLPFQLTGAQQRVVKEIRFDVGTGKQMNRLLQGDVGSGKTMVALLSMLIAIDNDFQACLMAPTEILAVQHYHSIKEALGAINVAVALLTGSVKGTERKTLFEDLEAGNIQILIGTHALIEDKVVFKNLGLAVIDEQHRFGVAQRAKLWRKNDLPPHVLVMTATPIPRTLAMSVYGDLDISVIDELPPGRKEIKTVLRSDANRLDVFRFMQDEIAKGRQVYIVYPLIQESEKMDYKDLMDGYESIARSFPLPEYQISIVHGQMKAADKDYEMQRFVEGKTHIMVATTVIEVGVNVPNASVMIIESAERFGLSQLHQLRGRVGRGADQSYCILMSGKKRSQEAQTRLQTMVQTNDGFEIAEVDLRLRGPGDLMGTQQSGVLQLKIADILKDQDILKTARFYAQKIVETDPEMEAEIHMRIRQTYAKIMTHKNIWNYIS
ncbi:ATP-dependent DNA helicase RecG [Flavobacteriaceae bacterium]|nr:ATP-dependent DNA helicase RecG [Flavobacteriaceae bacterium]MDA9330405.1 ATP-dependent DNA helicase RecG [Flavobacteriaceae bacterium]